MSQKSNNSSFKFIITIMIVACINMVLAFKVSSLNEKVDFLEKKITTKTEVDVEILNNLNRLKEQQEQIRNLEEQKVRAMQQHANAIQEIKSSGIHAYTDLVHSTVALNADDLNRIIDVWTENHDDSVLKGHGESFILASQETGLNPIYILAHAIEESGVGTSYLAKTKSNFFGINAVDSDPSQAYAMGDSVTEGIIAGARWIKENYYNEGCTSLQAMKDGGYASNDAWVMNIVSIANESISYL